jgi:hypothetical protein
VEEYQTLSAQSKEMTAEIRALADYFAENPDTCEVSG